MFLYLFCGLIVVVSKHLRDKKSGRSFQAMCTLCNPDGFVWRNHEVFEKQEATKNWIAIISSFHHSFFSGDHKET